MATTFPSSSINSSSSSSSSSSDFYFFNGGLYGDGPLMKEPLRQKLHAQLLSDRFRLDFMAAKPKAPSISDRNGDRHGGAGLKSRKMVEQEGIITFDAVPSEEDERFLRDDYERLVADVSASQSVSRTDGQLYSYLQFG